MLPTIIPIGALLSGIALLLLGSGLVNTVIPLRGSLEGFSTNTLGLIGSAVVTYGWEKLTTLIWFAVAVYIGDLVAGRFGVVVPDLARFDVDLRRALAVGFAGRGVLTGPAASGRGLASLARGLVAALVVA